MRSLGREPTPYPREIGSVHLLGHPEPLEHERGAHVLTVRRPGHAAGNPLPVLRATREAP